MNIKEYRIYHSQIIEQYQLIEYHLEGLFAIMLVEGDNFMQLAKRVENDAMGELIRKVKFLVKEYNFNKLLTTEDFKMLDRIRDDRNYYCHENFLEGKTDNYISNRKTNINEDLKLVKNMNFKLKEAFKKIKIAVYAIFCCLYMQLNLL